jgi:hypothetical protein
MMPQEPKPLQSPVWQSPSSHSESGSVLPAIGAHVPSVPPVLFAAHASHVPEQAVSQQTPSTQLPVPHWNHSEHAWPFASPHVRPSLCAHESDASLHTVQTSDWVQSGQVAPVP